MLSPSGTLFFVARHVSAGFSSASQAFLEAAQCDAFHQLLLEKEEGDQEREGGHVCGGQQNGVVDEVLALEERHADRARGMNHFSQDP